MPKSTVQESLLHTSFKQQIQLKKLKDFLSKIHFSDSEHQEYAAFSISIPSVDLLAVIEQDNHKDGFQYYWEKPIDEFSIAAAGEFERISSKGESRFKDSSSKGKEILNRVHHLVGVKHQNAVVHLFGGFSFFDENQSSAWHSYQSSSFTLPEWMIIREGNSCILTFLIKIDERSSFEKSYERILFRLSELEHITSAEQYSLNPEIDPEFKLNVPGSDSKEYLKWIETIHKAKDAIQEGEFEKVVLARQLRIELNKKIKDTHILNRLRFQYPDCYSFLIRQDSESSFIGSTPERLASFNSKFVLTEGLAGSISRGKTASEDAILEYNLLHSNKDLHEHDIVLEAIEENLEHYSDDVRHPKVPLVKKLSNVQHLYTPITAKIRDGVSRTEVLKTLHPTPAVGGFPRENAVAFIQEHENFNRGWYASPIGWINAHGNGEFIVAIRSGLIKNDEVRFFAGCGIVEDSNPEKEWEETNLKFIPMLTALEYAGT
ncbi:MAG: isochorismate synthase MenF [Balneolaceae bacterium]